MSAALTLRGVRKRYGSVLALNGVDLSLPRGVICGFIGPNGAGKTTTFSVLGGVVQPDAGEVDILGRGPFNPAVHAGIVGLLPQDCELNPYTPVRQLLVFYARLQGMTRGAADREADRVLDAMDLRDRAGSRIRQLSHGMRRRVAVGQALLGDPQLVLLDEPTSGLDPHLVVRVREVLAEQRGRRTLVVSSHVLAELEALCDYVVFIERGRIVQSGPLSEVTGQRREIRISLDPCGPGDGARAVALIEAALPGALATVEGDAVVVLAPPEAPVGAVNAQILPALISAGLSIAEVRRGAGLEASYLRARASSGQTHSALEGKGGGSNA